MDRPGAGRRPYRKIHQQVLYLQSQRAPPARLEIWTHESGGYDPADPQKWGRNTLTCRYFGIFTYGGCTTAPYWYMGRNEQAGGVRLQFTHTDTGKTVDITVLGEHHMFFTSGNYVLSHAATAGVGADNKLWEREPYFDFYILGKELTKLTLPGEWTATLKMDLRQWGTAPCAGDPNDPKVGCPGYLTLAEWEANVRIKVSDPGNQQIYLPAFPNSTPVVNLNLTSSPRGQGVRKLQGESTVDMCLYDGSYQSSSIHATLRFEDDGRTSPGRPQGAFSIRRLGGSQTDPRDRLDYQVVVANPIISTTDTVANGKTLDWQGWVPPENRRSVVLPGTDYSVMCILAPFVLKTPPFAAASKNAGDYTGTLRIIYTPST